MKLFSHHNTNNSFSFYEAKQVAIYLLLNRSEKIDVSEIKIAGKTCQEVQKFITLALTSPDLLECNICDLFTIVREVICTYSTASVRLAAFRCIRSFSDRQTHVAYDAIRHIIFP